MNQTEKNDLKGYAFLRNQIMHTGTAPSLREIGRVVGYASPRSVQLLLKRLEKRSLVSYVDGIIHLSMRKAQAMVEQTALVPLVGAVACGLPSLAEQEPEAFLRVSTHFAPPGHTYFMLRARGTSMNKSGINDGDLVLVRQQPSANDGEKIVALIDDEATIKHFHREGDVVILRPNSRDKAHKPIVLSDEFTIQGVVAAAFPATLY